MHLPALLLLASLLLSPSDLQSAETDEDPRLARVTAVLEELREEGNLPGLSVSIVLSDGTQLSAAVGHADPATKEALEPHHRLPAGSIGKSFLGALALHLAEIEELDLDAPAADWLGEEDWFVRLPGHATFTLRQLLRHESGVEEYYSQPEFREALVEAKGETTWSPEELTAFVADREGLFAPGEGWSYADTNYLIAGRAIERAAEGEFFDLVRRTFFVPHDLEGIVPTQRVVEDIAVGFTAAQAMFPFPERMIEDGRFVIDPVFEWTGGGFATRPRDLVRWMHLLYTGELLGEEATALLSADPAPANTGPGHHYAIATQLLPTGYGLLHGHSGWFPGWVSIAGYLPDEGVSIAVQVTTDRTQLLGPEPLVRIVNEVLEAAE